MCRQVTFSYKDYKHGGIQKEMTLEAHEFIRRFSMHILPKALVRIRHFGILSSTSKKTAAVIIKEQLPEAPDTLITAPGHQEYNPKRCPCCKKETMETMMRFNRRGPPEGWKEIAIKLLMKVTTSEVKNETA